MISTEIPKMARNIRLDGSLRSFIGLLLLLSLLYTRCEGAVSVAIIAVLAAYLIVISTWAYVAAGRILYEFCGQSAEEIENLRAELRELRASIGPAKNSG